MKSLVTVQKIARVLHILALIAKIFTIIGLVFSLVGAALLFAMPGIISSDIFRDVIDQMDVLVPVNAALALIAEAIVMAGQVVSAVFVCNFLKAELADGTPFTHTGARLLRKTAIIAFVAPLAAQIVASIMLVIAHVNVTMEFGFTGQLAAFLLSYLLDHGADLAANQVTPDKEFL